MKKLIAIFGTAMLAVTLFCGCKTTPNYIIMSSGTTLGFDVSESSATMSPQATIAYKRVELAIVPTSTNYTPDALMEFRFKAGFASQEIYSRVATGPHATTETPAALMMMKDVAGNINLSNVIPNLLTITKPKTK